MGLSNNITSVILLGFPNLQNITFLLSFLLVSIIYCGTLTGNLLITVLYLVSKTLHSPMYFFITQLSLCDILVTTDIMLTLLHTVLYGKSTIHLFECIIQYSLFVNLESAECLLLSLMSYDRYLAICNPLHYHSIMNHVFCVTSVSIIWLVGFIIALTNMICISNSYFCGPNVIDYFYCDSEPLLQLSCSDISRIHKFNLIIGLFLVMLPFIVIVASYVYIVITILKIPSSTGRHKAFSTCSSHLIVVSLFYGTMIMVYYVPTKGQAVMMSKILSLVYTVLTPMLNPIIYTLRNKDIKEALQKLKCFYNLHLVAHK